MEDGEDGWRCAGVGSAALFGTPLVVLIASAGAGLSFAPLKLVAAAELVVAAAGGVDAEALETAEVVDGTVAAATLELAAAVDALNSESATGPTIKLDPSGSAVGVSTTSVPAEPTVGPNRY